MTLRCRSRIAGLMRPAQKVYAIVLFWCLVHDFSCQNEVRLNAGYHHGTFATLLTSSRHEPVWKFGRCQVGAWVTDIGGLLKLPCDGAWDEFWAFPVASGLSNQVGLVYQSSTFHNSTSKLLKNSNSGRVKLTKRAKGNDVCGYSIYYGSIICKMADTCKRVSYIQDLTPRSRVFPGYIRSKLLPNCSEGDFIIHQPPLPHQFPHPAFAEQYQGVSSILSDHKTGRPALQSADSCKQ